MRRVTLGIALTAMTSCLVALPAALSAQCTASGAPDACSVPAVASLAAGRVVRLQMNTTSTPLTAPTTADFDAGFNSTTGPTLTISANAAWTVHIHAASAVWTASNTSPTAPARLNKPAGDLRWSTGLGGSFASLTTSDATLVNGSATASSATTLYFQTLYDWAMDTPGSYSLSVVLTLTAP
ncbi:MAG: hypothetical protein ACJ791_04625 [Gemmatimonadaceae bacterium]